MPQLDETQASVVMNICESHQLGVSCDTEDAEGSRGVSGGPAQGGDVGATMETQCPVEDRRTGRAKRPQAWKVHAFKVSSDPPFTSTQPAVRRSPVTPVSILVRYSRKL